MYKSFAEILRFFAETPFVSEQQSEGPSDGVCPIAEFLCPRIQQKSQ